MKFSRFLFFFAALTLLVSCKEKKEDTFAFGNSDESAVTTSLKTDPAYQALIQAYFANSKKTIALLDEHKTILSKLDGLFKTVDGRLVDANADKLAQFNKLNSEMVSIQEKLELRQFLDKKSELISNLYVVNKEFDSFAEAHGKLDDNLLELWRSRQMDDSERRLMDSMFLLIAAENHKNDKQELGK